MKEPASSKTVQVKPKTPNIDMLLDFDSEISSSMSVMPTSAPALLPAMNSPQSGASKSLPGAPAALPPLRVSNKTYQLLPPGLNSGFGIAYKFPRRPFIYSAKMVAVELTFTNTTEDAFQVVLFYYSVFEFEYNIPSSVLKLITNSVLKKHPNDFRHE